MPVTQLGIFHSSTVTLVTPQHKLLGITTHKKPTLTGMLRNTDCDGAS